MATLGQHRRQRPRYVTHLVVPAAWVALLIVLVIGSALLVSAAVGDTASIDGWLPSIVLVGLVPLMGALQYVGPRPRRPRFHHGVVRSATIALPPRRRITTPRASRRESAALIGCTLTR